jgi:hypothetical protein
MTIKAGKHLIIYTDKYMAKKAIYSLMISTMSMDSFDWDPEKDLANQAKHGISFSWV